MNDLKYEGREIGHEEMRELAISAYDAEGKRLKWVRSVRDVAGGIVVKILGKVHNPDYDPEKVWPKGSEDKLVALKACDKCGNGMEVVEFSGMIRGGFIAQRDRECQPEA